MQSPGAAYISPVLYLAVRCPFLAQTALATDIVGRTLPGGWRHGVPVAFLSSPVAAGGGPLGLGLVL